MMVRLIGPTGMERIKPLMNPVRAASRIGWKLAMHGQAAEIVIRSHFVIVFLFDFVTHLAGNARANETVNQDKG